jgi:hypothetical protein
MIASRLLLPWSVLVSAISPRLDLRRQRHRQPANQNRDDDQHDREFDQGEAA